MISYYRTGDDSADVHLYQSFLIMVPFIVVLQNPTIFSRLLLINKARIFTSDKVLQ